MLLHFHCPHPSPSLISLLGYSNCLFLACFYSKTSPTNDLLRRTFLKGQVCPWHCFALHLTGYLSLVGEFSVFTRPRRLCMVWLPAASSPHFSLSSILFPGMTSDSFTFRPSTLHSFLLDGSTAGPSKPLSTLRLSLNVTFPGRPYCSSQGPLCSALRVR